MPNQKLTLLAKEIDKQLETLMQEYPNHVLFETRTTEGEKAWNELRGEDFDNKLKEWDEKFRQKQHPLPSCIFSAKHQSIDQNPLLTGIGSLYPRNDGEILYVYFGMTNPAFFWDFSNGYIGPIHNGWSKIVFGIEQDLFSMITNFVKGSIDWDSDPEHYSSTASHTYSLPTKKTKKTVENYLSFLESFLQIYRKT